MPNAADTDAPKFLQSIVLRSDSKKKCASIVIDDIELEIVSEDFRLNQKLMGDLEGRLKVNLRDVTIRIEALYGKQSDGRVLFEQVAVDMNVVKDKVGVVIEPTNVAMNDFTATVIEVGTEVLRRVYVDEIVGPLKKGVAEAITPEVLNELFVKRQLCAAGANIVADMLDETRRGDAAEMVMQVNLVKDKQLGEQATDIRLSIPRLMLLGILYTTSAAEQRAARLYELLQPNLEDQIHSTSVDRAVFGILARLSFFFAIKHYNLSVDIITKDPNLIHGDHEAMQAEDFVWRKVSPHRDLNMLEWEGELVDLQQFIDQTLPAQIIEEFFSEHTCFEQRDFVRRMSSKTWHNLLRPEGLRQIICNRWRLSRIPE